MLDNIVGVVLPLALIVELIFVLSLAYNEYDIHEYIQYMTALGPASISVTSVQS